MIVGEQEFERISDMLRKSKNIAIGITICIFIALALIISSGVFGVPANNIEQDARKNQKIDSTWEVSKSVNSGLGAMIFYDDTLDDYIYSIYVNRDGFSFGYFFRSGGANSGIMDGICKLRYDPNGSALISMNKAGVARIDLDNGVNVTRIDIDPTKPFAVVIPINSGSVTLYDINKNVVPITVEANEG